MTSTGSRPGAPSSPSSRLHSRKESPSSPRTVGGWFSAPAAQAKWRSGLPKPMARTRHSSRTRRGLGRARPAGRRTAGASLSTARREDGHWDVWTIEADGGSPRRLTKDPGNENQPRWSRDGRFIYFAAQREGGDSPKPDIWRVPVAGGAEERITHAGGGIAQESIDGKTLFFMRGWAGRSPLVAQPVAGGPEREVVKCVSFFVVSTAGIYYGECSGDVPLPPGSGDGPGADRRKAGRPGWSPQLHRVARRKVDPLLAEGRRRAPT